MMQCGQNNTELLTRLVKYLTNIEDQPSNLILEIKRLEK